MHTIPISSWWEPNSTLLVRVVVEPIFWEVNSLLLSKADLHASIDSYSTGAYLSDLLNRRTRDNNHRL